MFHCCCSPANCSSGSLVVTVTFNCSFTEDTGTPTVELQYGTTTITLTSPNDSGKYKFTSTSGSGWPSGTMATVTVSDPEYLTRVIPVVLGCGETDLTVMLTLSYLKVQVKACGALIGDACPMATITATQSGNTFGPVTSNADCSYVNLPITVDDDGTGYIFTVSSYGCITYMDNPSLYFPYPTCEFTIFLNPDASHICCDCANPTCLELTLTTALGTCTLVQDPTTTSYFGHLTATVSGLPPTVSGDCYFVPFNCSVAPEPVSVTFYYGYSCSTGGYPSLGSSFLSCHPGDTDPTPASPWVAVADVVGGEGGGYGYDFAGSGSDMLGPPPCYAYMGNNFGHGNTTGSFLTPDSLTLDSCSPGAFAAHGTFSGTADQYSGDWTLSEVCGSYGPTEGGVGTGGGLEGLSLKPFFIVDRKPKSLSNKRLQWIKS